MIRQTLRQTVAQLTSVLHQRDGQRTRQLLLSPGQFGLGLVPERRQPDAITSMVCGYCSTGCSLDVHLQDGQAINLTPTSEYPVNLGMACPKGWESLRVLDSPDRATTPLLKNQRGRLEAVGWDTALRTFVERIKQIQAQHGAESVAFISTGQIATEEMALLGALAKFGMGLVHGDGNTRQCMATSVVAYKQAFGFDAPPYTYQDFEESDVLMLVGANLCLAHPILWERVVRNPHDPQIIVVDPRTTETAMQATRHLALKPKSDLALFYGLAQVLLEEGWIDRLFIEAHTSGFSEFATFLRPFTPEVVEAATGIDEATLRDIARIIHEGRRVSFWWTMGVNQGYEAVRTAQAIINLALMTGNIGRPGTGANSITGQCNAMGSRLFSNTTNLLGGYDFLDAEHRRKVANILGIDDACIPSRNSWAYHEIVEGILQGKIKGLWIIATNPAHSWINQGQLHDILGRLDFLAVQDMYHNTETARRADLVLPAAAWGEKEGTFINSERRIGTIKKVRQAPGMALADFSIFRLIAHYWGCAELLSEWDSPPAVFQILKRLSAGQPCDISGIEDYQMLDRLGGIQWPFPSDDPPSEQQRRLFADGRFYHPDGRARFLFEAPRPMPEPPNNKYPFLLLTGRGSASQWHTQTRTRQSPVLRKLCPQEIYVEINPLHARELAIKPNELVLVESQRGCLWAKAFLTATVRPGQVFIPMHYDATNQLTDAVFDPYSKQPSYKACAVRIRRESVSTKSTSRGRP
ncbi:MAG: molybdopterin-dependent oxidoreductase [Planctomycetia bacterium]|nr:molybdopterin-dependent oxidoreductase [Planctomycetia bacterium]